MHKSGAPLDPETALPWQKLAAALSDLLGDPPASGAGPGLDAHESRVQAVADMLIAKGLVDPAEMQSRMEALAVRLAGDKDRAHPKTRFSNAAPNDIGGLPGGPIDTSAGTHEGWHLLVTAIGAVLGARGLTRIDERRRSSEDLGEDYHRLGYFERMAQGGANLLYEKGILTREEVERRIEKLRQRK